MSRKARAASARRAEVAAQMCPLCMALAGEPCRDPDPAFEHGRATGFHVPRMRAAGFGPDDLRPPVTSPAPRRKTASAKSATPARKAGPSWLLRPEPGAGVWQLPGTTRLHDIRFRPDADAGLAISFAPSALEAISGFCRDSQGLETGGAMVGTVEVGRRHVVDVCGPGPRARRTQTGIEPDADYEQRWVGDAVATNPSRLTEVGGWHSHPAGGTIPSPADLQRAAGLATVLGIDRFATVLVSGDWRRPTLTAWVLRPSPGPWDFDLERGAVA